MQEVQEKKLPDPIGLRERKRSETHARIQAEAMRLFIAHGFEVTTLDDIAAAADVSRRTLFHYFDSKEEIVFSIKSDLPELVGDAITRRPASEPLLDMVENALIDLSTRYPSPQGRELTRLIRDTPALHAGDQAKYAKVEQMLGKALATRKNLPQSDMACRVMAATAVGIMKVAVDGWLSEKKSNLEKHIRAVFTALRRIAG